MAAVRVVVVDHSADITYERVYVVRDAHTAKGQTTQHERARDHLLALLDIDPTSRVTTTTTTVPLP